MLHLLKAQSIIHRTFNRMFRTERENSVIDSQLTDVCRLSGHFLLIVSQYETTIYYINHMEDNQKQ
jgi:hypothetical protein